MDTPQMNERWVTVYDSELATLEISWCGNLRFIHLWQESYILFCNMSSSCHLPNIALSLYLVDFLFIVGDVFKELWYVELSLVTITQVDLGQNLETTTWFVFIWTIV